MPSHTPAERGKRVLARSKARTAIQKSASTKVAEQLLLRRKVNLK